MPWEEQVAAAQAAPRNSIQLDRHRRLGWTYHIISLHFVMVVQEGLEDRVGTNGKEERVNGAAERGDQEEVEEEDASDSPEAAELELDR